jgi:MFS transporter, ACS family, D-galactonate transporter
MMRDNIEVTKSIASAKPETGKRWTILALLTVGTVINYIDRVNFGVATPTIMKEFGLGTGEMGILMSAFFWAYVIAMLPSGHLLNKLGAKKVYGIAGFSWGIVTMLTGLCQGYYSFFATRIAMGITEAPAFPANVRVVSMWMPKRERVFASAMFDGAARMGGAFAPPLVAFVIAAWGWRSSFVITGALAVVWAIIWLMYYHEPSDHPTISASELAYIRQDEVVNADGTVETHPIPMYRLLTYPAIRKLVTGYFMYIYLWTVFLYWIPTYLMKTKGLSLKEMGIAAGIPYMVGLVTELIGGKIWDGWYNKGASIDKVRRTGAGILMFGSAIFIWLTTLAITPFWAIFWLSAFMGIYSFGGGNVWSMPGDLAPYGQAGGVTGVFNFIGMMAAIIAPIVTGYMAQTKYGFNGAFVICSILAVVGGLFFIFNTYTRLKPKMQDL